MSKSSLAEKWQAVLQLAKVHEPKLYDYIRSGRAKGETHYNIQVVGKSEQDCEQLQRGVKVFADLLDKLVEMVWGESKGIKVAQADGGDFSLWEEEAGGGMSDEELRRLAWERFYPEIRQQAAAELQGAGQLVDEGKMAARLLEELKSNQENAEIEEKINLIGRGNQELTVALKTWEKVLKFIEHRDMKKLDALANELDDKLREFLKTLTKLEK